MFGSLVTTGAQIEIATAGYIVRFNLTSNNLRVVNFVQAQSSSVTSAPATTALSKSALHSLLVTNTDALDIAFAQSGSNLDVFLKTATYPYTSATRVGFRFYRSANNLTLNTQSLDIPEKTRLLCKLLILQETYRSQNLPVPQPIKSAIESEKTLLGYT